MLMALCVLAVVLSAAALSLSLFNQFQQRQRDDAMAQFMQATVMSQTEGGFRELYRDFGVEFPEGYTTMEELGAPLQEMIESLQQGQR